MRMQVVAEIVTAKALVAQTEPFKAECSACRDERNTAACECRLLPCKQPAADAGCCRGSESMAAQTEPFKAECSACCDERDAAACECRLLPCKQPAAAAGCCCGSEGKAAQMEPGGRSEAPGKCCAACSWMRMQTCCTGNNRLRTQAVTVIRTAKHCSGNEAL